MLFFQKATLNITPAAFHTAARRALNGIRAKSESEGCTRVSYAMWYAQSYVARKMAVCETHSLSDSAVLAIVESKSFDPTIRSVRPCFKN